MLQDFKDLVLSFVTSIKYIFIYYPSLFFRASSLNGDGIDPFMVFLEGLVGGKERIDNLRLLLQVALLISLIFFYKMRNCICQVFMFSDTKLFLYVYIDLKRSLNINLAF